MEETPTRIKEPKISIESIDTDGTPISLNGDGVWHDLNLFASIIKKFRLWFIFTFLVIASFSFWYITEDATYEATAKFIITDWSEVYPASINTSMYTPDRVNQMLMLFLSDSVIHFIIDKYHLDAGLKGPGHEKERQKLESDISGWISINQSLFNSFSLVVNTPDRYLSASVANDIINEVKETSRGMYVRDIASRIDVLKRLLNTVSGSDSASDDFLESHFARIQEQLSALSSKNTSSAELKNVLFELNVLQKQYDDRMVQLRINELMLKQVTANGASSITLIQKALPDFTNYIFIRLVYSIVLGLFACAILPFLIYLFYKLLGKKWSI